MNTAKRLKDFMALDSTTEDGLLGRLGNAIKGAISGARAGFNSGSGGSTAPRKGKYGLQHPDGTPCNAKSPDKCPIMHAQLEKRKEKEDDRDNPPSTKRSDKADALSKESPSASTSLTDLKAKWDNAAKTSSERISALRKAIADGAGKDEIARLKKEAHDATTALARAGEELDDYHKKSRSDAEVSRWLREIRKRGDGGHNHVSINAGGKPSGSVGQVSPNRNHVSANAGGKPG